jgi:hypothetical protein
LEPHWNPLTFPLVQAAAAPVEHTAAAVLVDAAEQAEVNEHLSTLQASPPGLWDGSGIEIVRATRSWIQYGTLAFAVICIVIGAVEALFGR